MIKSVSSMEKGRPPRFYFTGTTLALSIITTQSKRKRYRPVRDGNPVTIKRQSSRRKFHPSTSTKFHSYLELVKAGWRWTSIWPGRGSGTKSKVPQKPRATTNLPLFTTTHVDSYYYCDRIVRFLHEKNERAPALHTQTGNKHTHTHTHVVFVVHVSYESHMVGQHQHQQQPPKPRSVVFCCALLLTRSTNLNACLL